MRYCATCGEPKRTPEGKHTHLRPVVPRLSKAAQAALPRECPVDAVIEDSDTQPAVLRSARLAKVIRQREAGVAVGMAIPGA